MLATNPVHNHEASRFSGAWHLFAYRPVCWHERAIERLPFKVSIVAWVAYRKFCKNPSQASRRLSQRELLLFSQ